MSRKPDAVISDLHACAGVGSECQRCSKTCAYGCARDLKVEAAATIHNLTDKLEAAKRAIRHLLIEHVAIGGDGCELCAMRGKDCHGDCVRYAEWAGSEGGGVGR